MAKVAELRSKKAEELTDMINNLKKEQFNLRFQSATGELENTARVRQVRREIARAKTVLNESLPKARKSKKKEG